MRITGTTLAEVDNICDYIPIPGLSTITNLVDLILKCFAPRLSTETPDSKFWAHIQTKGICRCFILLIPIIGNIYAFVTDYFEYQNDKVESARQMAEYQNIVLPAKQKFEDSARKFAEGVKSQTPPELAPLVSGPLKAVENGLNFLQSSVDDIESDGPCPRTGMEIIFGKLNWPQVG